MNVSRCLFVLGRGEDGLLGVLEVLTVTVGVPAHTMSEATRE